MMMSSKSDGRGADADDEARRIRHCDGGDVSSVHVHARGRGTKTCMSCGLRLWSGPSRTTSAPLALLCLRVRGSSATAAWGGVDLRSCAARRLCLPRDASQHPEVSARPFPRRTGDARSAPHRGRRHTHKDAGPNPRGCHTPSGRPSKDSGGPPPQAGAGEIRPQPRGEAMGSSWPG